MFITNNQNQIKKKNNLKIPKVHTEIVKSDDRQDRDQQKKRKKDKHSTHNRVKQTIQNLCEFRCSGRA